ncbi:MAG: GntR family transcriptional regulator [Pseudomonadota bacterium]
MTEYDRKKLQSEAAYALLKRQILDNQLTANTQMLENEIASQLKMSRTPVREALQQLAREGLIDVIPRHGMRVKPVSPDDMAEIYSILTGLECVAVETLALNGLDSSGRQVLEHSVDQMDTSLEENDLDRWAQADQQFHRQLVSLTGNRRLISIVNMLWDQCHRARLLTLRLRPPPLKSNQEHREVFDAIVRGDAKTAASIHREHRHQSGEMLVALLRELGLQQL